MGPVAVRSQSAGLTALPAWVAQSTSERATARANADGPSCGKHPQVCVDWCDAYSCCESIGKRLCGAIGSGSNNYLDLANHLKSQCN